MCGIAGKIYFNSKKSVSENLIREMVKALVHRGPDDSGVFVAQNVGLGHARLSIIDLSPAGRQPMSNEDKTLFIIFNGEIYNFLELRDALIKKGHQFKSAADTEVILHLYEDHKENCLKFLRGMFAFAIWDKTAGQIFLARDRVGKKPLKYYIGPDFLIFASELKAILKDPEVKKEIDFNTIWQYLSFQYVPSPLTGFKNIKKLPAGHYMTMRLPAVLEAVSAMRPPNSAVASPKVFINRYWQLDYRDKWNLPEKEWGEKILNKLEESVKIRMRSDVPLGAWLSGGIDSSAVVALMSRLSNKPVKTFSVGFAQKPGNELAYARLIAKKFKTGHQEIFVKPEAIKILPKMIEHYEEPFADPASIATWYLSEATRKYVKVALNGDGGDENFAGYERYLFYKTAKQFPLFISLAARFWLKNSQKEKAKRFIERFKNFPEESYLELVSYFNKTDKEKLFLPSENRHSEGFSPKNPVDFGLKRGILRFAQNNNKNQVNLALPEIFNFNPCLNWLDKMLNLDFNTYLPDDLLVKNDIASMSNSLEVRSPMLDYEFLELCAKIPPHLKICRLTQKYIFKKAVGNLLPQEIIYRKKSGFPAPLAQWLRNELKDYIEQTLLFSHAKISDFLNQEKIKKILNIHASGKTDFSNQIWILLCLELWLKKYF